MTNKRIKSIPSAINKTNKKKKVENSNEVIISSKSYAAISAKLILS